MREMGGNFINFECLSKGVMEKKIMFNSFS